MAYIIERPQINGLNEKEQLAQMRNYLFKQAEQLQYALNNIETGGSSNYKTSQSPQSASAMFGTIKGLIMDSSEIIEAYYSQMEPLIIALIKANGSTGGSADSVVGGGTGGGIDADQIYAIIEEALQSAKDSGEFDGDDGVSATHKWNGTTLTVTSASGTSSADLKGEKGNQGEDGTSVAITDISESELDGGINTVTFSDGKKLNIRNGSSGSAGGSSGITEADKNEMVNMVLASLQTWSGGNY